jgi:hypothetical protein
MTNDRKLLKDALDAIKTLQSENAALRKAVETQPATVRHAIAKALFNPQLVPATKSRVAEKRDLSDDIRKRRAKMRSEPGYGIDDGGADGFGITARNRARQGT